MPYGDMGNRKMYERYEVETDDGLLCTSQMDRWVGLEKEYRAMGVNNTCPRCFNPCAMFFGDPNSEHWCLGCQILADVEGQR